MPKANETAIAVAGIATLDNYVNSFVAELSAVQQTAVRDAVKAIQTAQLAMVQARLVVGEQLAKLHNVLGQESFDKFLGQVGNRIGISRSTAYRYFGGFKMVHGQFGQVAANVLALTDGGNSIVRTVPKTGAIGLTPEAKTVLAKMQKDAPLPANPTDSQKEQWARTFTQLVVKEGRTAKAKSAEEICEERISKMWESYGDLIERINKLKGAKERKAVLDSLGDTLTEMQSEHTKLLKTISPGVNAPKTPKAKKQAPAPAEKQAA